MRKKIGECLVQAGLITDDDLRLALAEQRRTGERVGQVLVRLNFVTDKQITKALAYQAGYAYVSLSEDPPDPAAVTIIPRSLAAKHECVGIKLDGRMLTVAVCDPLNVGVIEQVHRQTAFDVRLVVATRTDIRESIEAGYVEKRVVPVSPMPSEARAFEAAAVVDMSGTQIEAESTAARSHVGTDPDMGAIAELLGLVLDNRHVLSRAIEESQHASDPDRLTIAEVKRITANVRRLIARRCGEDAAIEAAVASRDGDELEEVQAGLTAAEELLRVLSRLRATARPCPGCSAAVAIDFNACPHCGHRLRDGCSRCARPLDPSWSFCPQCAAAAPQKRRSATERSGLDVSPSNIAEFKNQNR